MPVLFRLSQPHPISYLHNSCLHTDVTYMARFPSFITSHSLFSPPACFPSPDPIPFPSLVAEKSGYAALHQPMLE